MQSDRDINGLTPKEILSVFYVEANLPPDGGVNSPYVKIEITPKFHFYIPNPPARRKAVIKHDMHHLVTGYKTDIAGESEISAWEIASGCINNPLVFAIDTSGTMLGYLGYYKRILKAYARGRRTKNLYSNQLTDEQALTMTVGELRKALLLDQYPINVNPTITDFILFNLFTVFGAILSIASLVLLPLVIVYSIFIELRQKRVTTGTA